jgi:fructose-1-phosphate kinase PfkB-like protein
MEGAAKEFGSEVIHASKAQQEEFLASMKELAAATSELVHASREMPRAFGEAVTEHLLKEASFQRALHGFSVLAQSPQHLAASIEKGPSLLAAKLEAFEANLNKEDGFVTQQRNALIESLTKEREAITKTIEQERANVMKDLDALTTHAINEVFSQTRLLVENALWLAVLPILVLWGLPFATGFLVGRLVRKKNNG